MKLEKGKIVEVMRYAGQGRMNEVMRLITEYSETVDGDTLNILVTKDVSKSDIDVLTHELKIEGKKINVVSDVELVDKIHVAVLSPKLVGEATSINVDSMMPRGKLSPAEVMDIALIGTRQLPSACEK